jgi:CheY-like chemotaxis protein
MDEEQPIRHPRQPREPSTSLDDARPRVLLAEDDAAMRTLVARRLRDGGFEVVEARSGHDALELLAQALTRQPPLWFDLIISDVRMPGYDGLNILVCVQQLPVHIPVILITAFGTTQTHAAAERLGALALLDKPFDVDELVRLARAAILLADDDDAEERS